MVQCEAVFHILTALCYCAAIASCVAGFVDVNDQRQFLNGVDLNLFEVCERGKVTQRGEAVEIRDCVRNTNELFAVAIVCALCGFFAAMGLMALLNLVVFVKSSVMFLYFYTGRGFYLLVIALLALGIAGNLGLATFLGCGVVGALQVLLGFTNRSEFGTSKPT